MTRPRLIAVLILLGTVACIAPWWEEVWLAVAYRELPDTYGFTVFSKRIAFLPGPQRVPIDEVCKACNAHNHASCYHYWEISKEHHRVVGKPRVGVLLKTTFLKDAEIGTCICPTCYPERQ